MSDIYKGELQDNLGNTIYPHTESDLVFCADGKTVQEKLAKTEDAIGSVTGTTDSLEVSDKNILATSVATKALKDRMTASDSLEFQFATDGEGNYGYLGADDSFIPFKKGVTITLIGRELSSLTAQSVGVASYYDKFGELTASNFWAKPLRYYGRYGTDYADAVPWTQTYDASNGIITIGEFHQTDGGGGHECQHYITYDLYLIV